MFKFMKILLLIIIIICVFKRQYYSQTLKKRDKSEGIYHFSQIFNLNHKRTLEA